MSVTSRTFAEYLRTGPQAEAFMTDPQFRYAVELGRSILADIEILMRGNDVPEDTITRVIHGAVHGTRGIDHVGRMMQANAVAHPKEQP